MKWFGKKLVPMNRKKGILNKVNTKYFAKANNVRIFANDKEKKK